MNDDLQKRKDATLQIFSILVLLAIQIGNAILSLYVAREYGNIFGIVCFVFVLLLSLLLFGKIMARHMIIDSDE